MAIAPPRDIPNVASLDLNLATQRLTLRPLVETDVDALWPLVSDPELPKLMSWSAHTSREETVAYVRSTAEGILTGSEIVWAILRDDQLVGCIGLHAITWQVRAWRIDRAELGYWIAPAMWKQGLATEAAMAVMKFAFETLGLHKLWVGCVTENVGSTRVIEKCGFRFLYRTEEHIWRERWMSYVRYEMTVGEWSDVMTSTLRFSRPRQL